MLGYLPRSSDTEFDHTTGRKQLRRGEPRKAHRGADRIANSAVLDYPAALRRQREEAPTVIDRQAILPRAQAVRRLE